MRNLRRLCCLACPGRLPGPRGNCGLEMPSACFCRSAPARLGADSPLVRKTLSDTVREAPPVMSQRSPVHPKIRKGENPVVHTDSLVLTKHVTACFTCGFVTDPFPR